VDVTHLTRNNIKNSIAKKSLDLAAAFVTQNGSKLYFQFSHYRKNLNYPHYMYDLKFGKLRPLSPFTINVDGKGKMLRMLEMSEILLFDCTNLTGTVDHLRNHKYIKILFTNSQFQSHFRPIIQQNDPRFIRYFFPQTFTITQSYSFNFLTCDGVFRRSIGKINNFLMFYFTPFDFQVWSVLLCLLITLTLMMTCFVRFANKLRSITQHKYLSDVWFNLELVVSSLYENGRDFDIQRYFKSNKQLLQGPLYLLLAGLTLSLIVFNNVYKGILTSNELVQFPLEVKWKTICDLANQGINIVTFIRPEEEHKYSGSSSKLNSSLSQTFFGNLYGSWKRNNRTHGSLKSKCKIKWESNSSYLRKNLQSVYEHLSSCDKVTVVDSSGFVDLIHYWFNLKSSNKTFVKGSDKFLPGNLGFMIIGYSQPVMGRVQRRLRFLVESGILKLFQDWFKPEGSEQF